MARALREPMMRKLVIEPHITGRRKDVKDATPKSIAGILNLSFSKLAITDIINARNMATPETDPTPTMKTNNDYLI